MKATLEPVGLFFLLVLVVYRLARMIAVDDGPADILLKFRAILGAYDYGENMTAKTSLGRGIICPYCVGFWLAAFLAIGFYPWPDNLLYWLALAGAQSFLQSLGRQS